MGSFMRIYHSIKASLQSYLAR